MGESTKRYDGDAELLPLARAAQVAGVSTRTLDLWARRGLVASVLTTEGRRLISRAELAKHVVTLNPAQPPDD